MSWPGGPIPPRSLRVLLEQTKEDSVNEKDVFILADQALKSVVDQIRDDHWQDFRR